MILDSSKCFNEKITPLDECTFEHLYRSSISKIVKFQQIQGQWHSVCTCSSCGVPADGFIELDFMSKSGKHTTASGFFVYRGTSYLFFTFDHIWPRSLGGRNGGSNGQVMCYSCNEKKADKVDEDLVNFVETKRDLFISPDPSFIKLYKQYVRNHFPHIPLDKPKQKKVKSDFEICIIFDY